MSHEIDDLLQRAGQARGERRLADAQRDLLLAVELLRQAGARAELAQALKELGEVERHLPDGDGGRRHYEESVAIWRELDDPIRLAHTVRHLGDVHRAGGRPALAEPCYHEALALYRGSQETRPLDLANAIRSLAVLKEEAGERVEAGLLWEEAHDLYTALGVTAGVAESAARRSRLERGQNER
jgi:tetratricopeptide (TPR) repeat protein